MVSDAGPEAGGIGVTFHGVPLSTADGTIGLVGDPVGATPCWSSGGGTGQSGGNKRTYSYRYDVLRFLPVVNGRHRANGLHPVGLPDLGTKKSTPRALGASLVVVYRDPDLPLSALVIYDGSWVMDNSTHGMTQTIEGFYDPADVSGKMTFIVGNGQPNKSEILQVGQNVFDSPFTGNAGNAWDNVTDVTDSIVGQDSLVTSVQEGSGSSDCLTGSAIIYQTAVNDTDEDGLLDAWEAPNASPLSDPNGQPLPDLYAMGARDNQKDLFAEIGYMFADGDPTTQHWHWTAW